MRSVLTVLLAAAALTLPSAGSAHELPAWLAGTWAMEDGSSWADEVWLKPRGTMMLGMGRAGFGPEVESWSAMRLVRRGDGALALFMEPKGGSPVEFAQTVVSAQSVEFANGAHDFPQRIRLWREGQLLMIEQSKLDGSEPVRRNYRPVETAPKD